MINFENIRYFIWNWIWVGCGFNRIICSILVVQNMNLKPAFVFGTVEVIFHYISFKLDNTFAIEGN